MLKGSVRPALILALAACPRPVLAQQPAPPPKPMAISVTVTDEAEPVESVGTTRRIGRAEIEARNARTLDEALRLFPGVYVRTGGDGTPRIDVRGFRSRHVLLLINGVQVNSTADGQFDPARITTQAIREIKISYGSSSVLYGDNALAGVIEVTTVDGRPDATIDLSGGFDQKGAGGRYAGTVGHWSLMASASGYGSNGFRLADSFAPTSAEDGGRRQNSDRDRGDVRASIGYRLSPTASIGSEWSYGVGSYGIPASVVDDATDIFAQTPRFERVTSYRAGSGQVSLLLAPWQRFNLRAWVYRNAQRENRSRYDDATYSSMDDPLVSGTFQTREQTTVTGSSALGRLDLGRVGSVRMALNQRHEALDSSGVIRDVTIAGTTGGSGGGGGGGGGGRGGGAAPMPTTFGVRSFSFDQHVDVYSAGAEWQARPLARVATVLGAAVNSQHRPGGESDAAPTWMAGVSFDAATAWRLHVSATRKIRVPSIDQLFNASTGNPDLRSEHAYGVDAGADYRLSATSSVGISAFSTDAHDFIERPASGVPFANSDHYRFRGGELALRTALVPRLDVRAAYSFLDAENITPAGTAPLQTRPRHRGSLEWVWTPLGGSSVRGAASYSGSQFYDSRGSAPVQRRVDGYGVVDLGFTQTLARRYGIAFDVTNLFDHLYEQSYGLPREGRAAVVTLRARLR